MKITRSRTSKISVSSPSSPTPKFEKSKPGKSQKEVFPLQYQTDGPLRVGLQEKLIALSSHSRERQRFLLDQCKASIQSKLPELKYRLKEDESYGENLEEYLLELSDYYLNGVYVDPLLERMFAGANDHYEKTVLLDILILNGGGYSSLIDRVLKNGTNDSRYEFCINYLKGLSQEAVKDFILTAWCDSENNKKSKNLAKALGEAFGEDRIIKVISEDVSARYVDEETAGEDLQLGEVIEVHGSIALEDDDESSDGTEYKPQEIEESEQAFYNELEDIAERQRFLLAVLKNSEKDRTEELTDLFNTGASWEISLKALDLVLKVCNGDKQRVAEFYLNILRSREKKFRPVSVGITLGRYALLLEKKAIPTLKEVVQSNDSPVVAHNFVDSMLTLYSKEGRKGIEKVIIQDIAENKKSPVLLFLFMVAGDSQYMGGDTSKEARLILHKIFSLHEDIASFIEMNIRSQVGFVEKFDQTWILRELKIPTIQDLVLCIGFEKMVSWMMYDKNPNVRRSARDLFAKALREGNCTKANDKNPSFDSILNDFMKSGFKKEGKNKIAEDFVAWADSI